MCMCMCMIKSRDIFSIYTQKWIIYSTLLHTGVNILKNIYTNLYFHNQFRSTTVVVCPDTWVVFSISKLATMVLNYIFLKANKMEHFFLFILPICIIYFLNHLFIFLHIFLLVVCNFHFGL